MKVNKTYDICVIGSGPGGYVAALRAAQLGSKVAIIEKRHLGGVCLNIGCIPTKALLRSAEVLENMQHANDYGINIEKVSPDFSAIIQRSKKVAGKMSKGVQFLLKKYKVDVFNGMGKFVSNKQIAVYDDKNEVTANIEFKNAIIATGARPRQLPHLPIDGKTVIDSEKAMNLKEKPHSLLVIGAGAIGVEFAYFYQAMGTKVTIVEMKDRLVPVEDEEIGKELVKIYKKKGMDIYTGSYVEKVEPHKNGIKAILNTPKGKVEIEATMALSAIGVVGNIEDMGLDKVGVKMEKGWIVVDTETYQTSQNNIYAIGDIIGGPWLAHKASHEALICVERLAGQNPQSLEYDNIPGCTYCEPQIASVGLTEKQAKEQGYDILVGKFPFSASGKAAAYGEKEGFVKVIFDKRYGEWLGCHMIGSQVTDMIAEAVVARKLETTGHEIISAIHPHPTLSETVMEAVAEAYGEGVHLGSELKTIL